MVTFEVTLPDRIESDIDRLVEQGEFVNQDQAIEELLSLGVRAYKTSDEFDEQLTDEYFSQAADDQQDPAGHQDDPL